MHLTVISNFAGQPANATENVHYQLLDPRFRTHCTTGFCRRGGAGGLRLPWAAGEHAVPQCSGASPGMNAGGIGTGSLCSDCVANMTCESCNAYAFVPAVVCFLLLSF